MSWEKNKYIRKSIGQSEYVRRRNELNSEIDTLTGLQHEQIRELCEMRHLLHSGDIFNTESSDYNRCSNFFFEKIIIEEIGNLDITTKFEELTLDIDLEFEYYEIEATERKEYDIVYSELKSRHYDQINNINKIIEDFLSNIDEVYDTSYCPTGKSRGRVS